jgi:hypothetical protein
MNRCEGIGADKLVELSQECLRRATSHLRLMDDDFENSSFHAQYREDAYEIALWVCPYSKVQEQALRKSEKKANANSSSTGASGWRSMARTTAPGGTTRNGLHPLRATVVPPGKRLEDRLCDRASNVLVT